MQVRKKPNDNYLNSFEDIPTTLKSAISPFQQVTLPFRGEATYAPTNGAVQANSAFERRDALLVSSPLVTLTEGKTMIQITYRHKHTSHIHTRQLCGLDQFQGDDPATSSEH